MPNECKLYLDYFALVVLLHSEDAWHVILKTKNLEPKKYQKKILKLNERNIMNPYHRN